MSLTVPGPARVILQVALQLANMDMLPSDTIYDATLQFDEETDGPLNTYFDEGGLSSLKAVRNLGSVYMYLVLVCCIGCIMIMGHKYNSRLSLR